MQQLLNPADGEGIADCDWSWRPRAHN